MVFFDPWVHKKIAEAFGLPWEREPPQPYETIIEERKRQMREELGITPGGPSLVELMETLKAQVIGTQQQIGIHTTRMAELTREAQEAIERAQIKGAEVRGQIEAILAGLQAPTPMPVTPPLFQIPEIRIPDWLKWIGIGVFALLILGLMAKVLK